MPEAIQSMRQLFSTSQRKDLRKRSQGKKRHEEELKHFWFWGEAVCLDVDPRHGCVGATANYEPNSRRWCFCLNRFLKLLFMPKGDAL